MRILSIISTSFIFSCLFLFAGVLHGQPNKSSVRLAWDYSSLEQIAERGGYPRLLRLHDSAMMVVYETYAGSIQLKKSINNGESWSAPHDVFSQFVYTDLRGNSTLVNMSNPEIIQLKNGDIIIACNYRPQKQEIAPYSIVVRRSVDNGISWKSPQILYAAAPRFKDGCWEPSFLQLPDGELQVYFANENPFQTSDEQEISMVSSKDNGISWTPEARTVSFRKGKRDGMPVSIILKDEIIVAIEDNKKDKFKPYTVRTTIADNWSQPVLGESENRNYALKNKVEDTVYMGAPYLLKLPNGQTLLSYQTDENRSSNWELSTMEVAIGDEKAKNFQYRTRPFKLNLNQQAKWNSLALWDSNTVVAFSSTDLNFKSIAPWLIKGHIIPQAITVKNKVEEWPIFVGSESPSNVIAGIARDEKNIIIDCKVKESNPLKDNLGVTLYFYNGKDKYKAWCAGNGVFQFYVEKRKRWQPLTKSGTVNIQSNSKGYNLICTLPVINEAKKMAFGISLSSINLEQKLYEEYLVHMKEEDVSSWIELKH